MEEVLSGLTGGVKNGGDTPEKESTCRHEQTNRQSFSTFNSFGPKWQQRFNKPVLTLSDVFAEQRKRATDVPTAAVSELQDARASHRSVHQPLDQNPSLVASRKRRHKTIREHTNPSSVGVFESIDATDNTHFHPNRLDSVDNKGNMTSRLFSSVSKLDYGKRRRLFSVETPSPAPSSAGEMDPDSPTMLKAQQIKASWEAPRKAATPEPVPQPRDYSVWLEALRQPPHPAMMSRNAYGTPSPGPRHKRHRRYAYHQVEDEDSDAGIGGMVHFPAPCKNLAATASDDDGVLHFAPGDLEDEEAEAEAGNEDTAAIDHAAEAWRGFTEADLKVQYGPDTVWAYDRNGDLCALI